MPSDSADALLLPATGASVALLSLVVVLALIAGGAVLVNTRACAGPGESPGDS